MKYTDPSGHYIESAIDVAFLSMDIKDIRTGNADKWTYIGLTTDVACLALPGVTGGRLGVQALEETVTHADNVGDLFKLLDKTAGVEKKVDNAIDSGQTVNKIGKADNFIKNIIGDLPTNPDELIKNGWDDVTPEGMLKNTGSREFMDKNSGIKIRYDKGTPSANGFKEQDHYHIYNPQATNKGNYYLDINGNPVSKGSKASHIIPKSGREII